MDIQRILAPIDFSHRSRNELQWATSLAMQFRAELISLHVVPLEVVTNALEWKNETWEGMSANYNSQARRLVEEIEAEAPALGLDHIEVVVAGKTVEGILDAVRKFGIDLIVMSTHGRTGVSHALMGSVAEKVVRLSPVPVLTLSEAAKPVGV